MSPIQTFKVAVVEALGISKDAMHIYIGAACFLLALTIWRRRPGSLQALLPGFMVSLVLEAVDLGDDYLHRGVLIWLPSVKDVINTNLIPLAVTLVLRFLPPVHEISRPGSRDGCSNRA